MQVGDSTEIFGCLECHRIEEESKELLEKPYGPLDELEKLWPEDEVDGNLFRLGRRLFFYHRAQQILDIMHPGREVGGRSRHRSDLAVPPKRYSRSGRVQRYVTVKTSTGIA